MGFVQRYQGRISGPLMDRIDIHTDVRRVPFEKLASLDGGDGCPLAGAATIRIRVERVRKTQAVRFAEWSKKKVIVNGDIGPAEVQRFCQLAKVYHG